MSTRRRAGPQAYAPITASTAGVRHTRQRATYAGGLIMASTSETGHATGTKDKLYNIIWFTEACLSNALRLETYIQDAERDGDNELAEFFRRAQSDSRKGGEQGKELLGARLNK
jgi:hypothetical protein